MKRAVRIRRFERTLERTVVTVRLRLDGHVVTRVETPSSTTPSDDDDDERSTRHASAAEAELSFEREAAELSSTGWEEVPQLPEPGSTAIKGRSESNPDLEAAIARDPGDLTAWRIYADWLTSRGDVRGELVNVQLLRARRPEDRTASLVESKLLASHGRTLLGPLHAHRHISGGQGLIQAFSWRYGFLRAARLWRTGPTPTLDEQVATLFEHPAGHLLEHLVLGPHSFEDDAGYEAAFRVIEARAPATLSCLSVGEGAGTVVGNASALFRLPGIRRLRLHHGPLELGDIGRSHLRALILDLAEPTPSLAESLRLAIWPELESLGIQGSMAPAITDMFEFGAPNVRALTLTEPSAEAIATVAESALRRRLARLTLWSVSSLAPLETLLSQADRFEALVDLRVHLTAAWSGSPIRRRLRSRFPKHEAFSSKHEQDSLEGGWD